jgi:hypothetical protein
MGMLDAGQSGISGGPELDSASPLAGPGRSDVEAISTGLEAPFTESAAIATSV